jgi:hypothetical protein
MAPRSLPITFDAVQLQDTQRSPLTSGTCRKRVSLNDFLRIARKSKDATAGSKIVSAKNRQTGFEKPAGLAYVDAFVEGQAKSTPTFDILQASQVLEVYLHQNEVRAILWERESELQAMFKRGGVNERMTLERIQVARDRIQSPVDLDAVRNLTVMFNKPVDSILTMKVPKVDENGHRVPNTLVQVYNPISVVMTAKGSEYESAKKTVYRLCKDYFQIEFDAFNNLPSGQAIVLSGGPCGPNTPKLRKIVVYKIRWHDGEGGGDGIGFEILETVEFLMVIPGCELSAQIRRRAADCFLRGEGGDQSYVDRIVAQKHFQDYLAIHDPDHPLRAVGEYAERRQSEEAVIEASRRAAAEAATAMCQTETVDELTRVHKKRMLELEYEHRKLQCSAETSIVQSNARAAASNAEMVAANALASKAVAEEKMIRTHEARRQERADTILHNMNIWKAMHPGQELSPQVQSCMDDQILTGLTGQERPDGWRGLPVYLMDYLKKKMLVTDVAAQHRSSSFGKVVKEEVLEMFPDYKIETVNRTVHGRERQVNCYYECHLPAIDKAFEKYLQKAPVQNEELSRAGGQARRQTGQQSLMSFTLETAASSSTSSTDTQRTVIAEDADGQLTMST